MGLTPASSVSTPRVSTPHSQQRDTAAALCGRASRTATAAHASQRQRQPLSEHRTRPAAADGLAANRPKLRMHHVPASTASRLRSYPAVRQWDTFFNNSSTEATPPSNKFSDFKIILDKGVPDHKCRQRPQTQIPPGGSCFLRRKPPRISKRCAAPLHADCTRWRPRQPTLGQQTEGDRKKEMRGAAARRLHHVAASTANVGTAFF